MQNKGLIKLFAILFGLVSIYQLSFTYVAGSVEDKAKAFAEAKVPNTQADYIAKREAVEAKYLDSMLGRDVYNIGVAKFTYAEIKEKELNRGLDLLTGLRHLSVNSHLTAQELTHAGGQLGHKALHRA